MRTVTQGPSQKEWEKVRPILTQLYFDQGKTLDEVCSLLIRRYGFKATKRMYKTRIKQWGLFKYHKDTETRQAEKRRITLKEAWKGMENLSYIAAQSTAAPPPSNLICSTAANSPEPVDEDEKVTTSRADQVLHSLSSPEEFKPMEQLLAAAKIYFSPTSAEFVRTIVRKDLRYSQELQEFGHLFHKAILYADLADWESAPRYYGKALGRVPEILKGNQSLNFLCANTTLPPHHPFCQLIHSIMTNHLLIYDMMELCLRAALGILKSENLSYDPRLRIIEYGLYETLFSRGQFFQARQLIRKTWEKEELLLGSRHTLTLWSMMAVGRCTIELGDPREADRIISDVIQRVQMVPSEGYCSQLRTGLQEHMHSCSPLQRRTCQHRQFFDELMVAQDNNSDEEKREPTCDPPDPKTILLEQNRSFICKINYHHPCHLRSLAEHQFPPLLWLGCSDSRVPETTVLDLLPGDVFTHRNIANVVTNSDLSVKAAVEYAVGVLGIKCVVVCGHTNCGGVKAVLHGLELPQELEEWLVPLRDLAKQHKPELDRLPPGPVREKRLAELNVADAVDVVTQMRGVQQKKVVVLGAMYDVGTGELTPLDDVVKGEGCGKEWVEEKEEWKVEEEGEQGGEGKRVLYEEFML